jgi:hypothetical protein
MFNELVNLYPLQLILQHSSLTPPFLAHITLVTQASLFLDLGPLHLFYCIKPNSERFTLQIFA